MTSARYRRCNRWHFLAAGLVLAGLTACGGSGDAGSALGLVLPPAPPPTDTSGAQDLACDDSMKTGFAPDANTSVLLARTFRKGDPLLLSGTATPATPIAQSDLCLVKLIVGPGHAGPSDAPSTTAGIGIEIWLPAKVAWNRKIHLIGGTGWAGGTQTSPNAISFSPLASPWDVAGVEGAVSATTDTGHTMSNGDFLMNADGTVNTVGWSEFSERGIHDMTLKTKALAKAYYGADAKYTYWHGSSTGGRQGLKQAQAYPGDFDGIIASSPAIHWTRFNTATLYGQLITQRDLGGVAMSIAQVNAVSAAALNACDMVGGKHLGYLIDPSQCAYDPQQDPQVLCTGSGGSNTDATTCVSSAQARSLVKVWYGPTRDGSVPAPATDTGYAVGLAGPRLWYGYPRGATLATSPFGGGAILGPVNPQTLATDTIALIRQDPTFATPSFLNATGNGADGWKNLTYADLGATFDRGIALQAAFGNINTDNPDLTAFQARGGKLITFVGQSDDLIPHQGVLQYYTAVANQLNAALKSPPADTFAAANSFYKLYLVPGMGHYGTNGTVNADANPPVPSEALKYAMLTDWVEKGIEPGRVDVTSAATSTAPAKSQPFCVYPLKATYQSGDAFAAASYACR
ncbi:tannase/feruloyl esterase family alpha/beta hydrolase [Variovorax sp. RKNM96]|nr:tannase/feruloyl esterase family alpha/beta hydrolase [Variovorax sp. RKNM96]